MARIRQVTDGVYRIADGAVNWYVLRDDTGITLVDSGWPRSWGVLQQALTEIGATTVDIRAVLLSHGHPDHQGIAERVRRETSAPVHGHTDEVPYLRGEAENSSPFALVPSLLTQAWRPTTIGFTVHAIAHGFMQPRFVREVQAFTDGTQLDVPGAPVAVHTPGHTRGHTSYHLPDRGVLLTGDALASYDVLTGDSGPRLMPEQLNADHRAAYRSLDRLEKLEGDLILPGHGDPLRRPIADSVAEARDRS